MVSVFYSNFSFMTVHFRCVKGLLKDKSVILATHQLQYLPQADQIIIIKDVCSITSCVYLYTL